MIEELDSQLLCAAYKKSLKLDGLTIPWLWFPSWAEVQVIYPFAGAAARFVVRHKNNPKEYVSVYMDTVENLGYFGEPHWEAYPINNNNVRFALADVHGLMYAIKKQLEKAYRKELKTSKETTND